MKDIVVISILGSSLDRGFNERRWNRWRPTPALVGHPDTFPVSRVEVLYTDDKHNDVLGTVLRDVVEKSPVTEVRHHLLPVDNPWDFSKMYAALFDFARSYPFDTAREEYYLQLATGTHVAKICMFLLVEAQLFPAKLVTTHAKEGQAPGEIWRGDLQVIDLKMGRYDAIASRFEAVAKTHSDLLRNGIQTQNKAFNDLIAEVEQVCMCSSAPMLITGPTGAGKSHLVAQMYALRKSNELTNGAFVEVNCATLRGDNAMSTLFGHKKGAYTGAIADRAGLLKEADGGILFLDEIGELGLEEQAVLLRALEDKRFTPMGSDKQVASDFQLIAGTNRDLNKEVTAGRFRADLLARLNVWTFRLPSMAERREDIEPNIAHEVKHQSKNLRRLVSFSADAHRYYLDFAMVAPWHGNFRDLRASIERMATLAPGGRIDLSCVEREIARLNASWAGLSPKASDAVERHAPTKSAGAAETAGPVDAALAPAEAVRAVLGDAADELNYLETLNLRAVLGQVLAAESAADVARRLYFTPGKHQNRNYSDLGKKALAKYGLSFTDASRKLSEMGKSGE